MRTTNSTALRHDADSPFEVLRQGRAILQAEGEALLALANGLDASFNQAVDLLLGCADSVIVTGMGKAGLVGQKLTATLASTGTRSHFLHPAEAFHGDLGRVGPQDTVLALSQSGETGELTQLLPSLREMQVPLIAITGRPESTLARAATVVLDIGRLKEAGPNGLAPSTSTTAMIALGDALALVASRLRGFRPEDFARFHPGGSLGRKLAKVQDMMRPLAECRLAHQQLSVREVFVSVGQVDRRTGAVMLTDDSGRLQGIFTDSDLAKLLEQRRDETIDQPIASVMTRHPATIEPTDSLATAVSLLASRKISELPVIDSHGKPVGMLDITDVVGLLPPEGTASDAANSTDSSQPAAPDTGEPPAIVPFTNQEHPEQRT